MMVKVLWGKTNFSVHNLIVKLVVLIQETRCNVSIHLLTTVEELRVVRDFIYLSHRVLYAGLE